MLKTRLTCCALAFCIAASGCSAFVPKTQAVTATCSEPDATIQIDGDEVYQGTAKFEARRNKPLSVACYKEGYYPAQKNISSSINWVGIADVIGTFVLIFPAVGVFLPGAWDLDETDINVKMVKEMKAPKPSAPEPSARESSAVSTLQ